MQQMDGDTSIPIRHLGAFLIIHAVSLIFLLCSIKKHYLENERVHVKHVKEKNGFKS